jgi:hypothetical protein
MFLQLFLFFTSLISTAFGACSTKDVAPMLDTLFPSLGSDCQKYISLFANNAEYYHQHDGYAIGIESLERNCQNYHSFCPGNSCKFLQQAPHKVVEVKGACHLLVPYIWSEIPVNNKVPNNMEPHTGWEYIIATPNASASFGFQINLFAEIETTYSVAYNRNNPLDSSVYQWTVTLLNSTASRGECDYPVLQVISSFFNELGSNWRQQGEAVVLAVGGLCHVSVPYASENNGLLSSSYIVLVLRPPAVNQKSYTIIHYDIFSE